MAPSSVSSSPVIAAAVCRKASASASRHPCSAAITIRWWRSADASSPGLTTIRSVPQRSRGRRMRPSSVLSPSATGWASASMIHPSSSCRAPSGSRPTRSAAVNVTAVRSSPSRAWPGTNSLRRRTSVVVTPRRSPAALQVAWLSDSTMSVSSRAWRAYSLGRPSPAEPKIASGKYVLVTVHEKTRHEGMDAAGVLPSFAGIACHEARGSRTKIVQREASPWCELDDATAAAMQAPQQRAPTICVVPPRTPGRSL